MLLLSKKKGPAAREYRQRGLPGLVPEPAPARGANPRTWATREQAGAHCRGDRGAEDVGGDTGVLRIQRMESCEPAFLFFKYLQKINTNQSSAS